MNKKPRCFVFDLDGTLMDSSPRQHLIPSEPLNARNWDKWNQAAHLDVPIMPMITVARALLSAGYIVALATVRSDDGWDATVSSLNGYGIPTGNLFMRVDGDLRPATEVKVDLYQQIEFEYEIVAGFDDDKEVVEALTASGYTIVNV